MTMTDEQLSKALATGGLPASGKLADMNSEKAIEFIKDFPGTEEELQPLLAGESRVTVLRAAEKKFGEAFAAPEPAPAPAKFIDPEDDRGNWPTIYVDFEDGKPNFAFISVSGTKQDDKPFTHDLRVQRGVDVQVPPSVVNMLRSTKQAHFHQVEDPVSGRMNMVKTERAPLPWQMVDKGKYC